MVDYKNYQILASVEEIPPLHRRQVFYQVRRPDSGGAQVSGVVAGAFDTKDEAEAAAILAGQVWVDHVALHQPQAMEAKERYPSESECTKDLSHL